MNSTTGTLSLSKKGTFDSGRFSAEGHTFFCVRSTLLKGLQNTHTRAHCIYISQFDKKGTVSARFVTLPWVTNCADITVCFVTPVAKCVVQHTKQKNAPYDSGGKKKRKKKEARTVSKTFHKWQICL